VVPAPLSDSGPWSGSKYPDFPTSKIRGGRGNMAASIRGFAGAALRLRAILCSFRSRGTLSTDDGSAFITLPHRIVIIGRRKDFLMPSDPAVEDVSRLQHSSRDVTRACPM